MKRWFFILMAIGLVACEEDHSGLAPVVEGPWHRHHATPHRYTVRAGDTLYSIAFRYDQDYRRLAAMNHLQSPYVVKVGQPIFLNPRYTSQIPSIRPVVRAAPRGAKWRAPVQMTAAPARVVPPRNTHWLWPTRGPIISGFAPEFGKKGIDIAGSQGQTIRATANGMVAYSGDGLPGYGNMILIQHSHQLLSAYGYNARNLVHAGQTVKAGQAIAIMGISPQRRNATHFELRKAGRPVNPRYFLR
jgi:lipoprotein NlpD